MSRIIDKQKQTATILADSLKYCNLSREELLQIFTEEWVYWHEAEFKDQNMSAAAIIALGALSNIISRIALQGKDL